MEEASIRAEDDAGKANILGLPSDQETEVSRLHALGSEAQHLLN